MTFTSLRHRAEYGLVVLIRASVRPMPSRLVAFCGRALGLAFYLADGPHRRLATANLRAAFPLRSAGECRALARSTFMHFGRLLVELLKFSTLSPEKMRARLEVDGLDRIEQAHAGGRGVLLLAGHFGYWEMLGIGHPLFHRPLGVVVRALDNPHLNALLERIRTATGNIMIYRRGALRRVLRELAANRGVAILIDQHIHGSDAVVVDFFERPAATTTALAALALRTGAPVIPVFALPLPGGRYRLIYEHAVVPPAEDSPDPVRDLTQRCTDVLEMYVRRYPHLWLWMHRRWRTVEPAEPVGGMFPAADRTEAMTEE